MYKLWYARFSNIYCEVQKDRLQLRADNVNYRRAPLLKKGSSFHCLKHKKEMLINKNKAKTFRHCARKWFINLIGYHALSSDTLPLVMNYRLTH